jgi:hypothetical protein
MHLIVMMHIIKIIIINAYADGDGDGGGGDTSMRRVIWG